MNKIDLSKKFTSQSKHLVKLKLKFILLFCSFLIILPFSMQCQNFIPLVDENKSWNCAWEIFDYQESYTIRMEGDTTINNLEYKKIIYDKHFYHSIEVIGYIREDSLGKVYSMNNSLEEGLLYDFGAKQGDTIMVHNTMIDSWDYECPFFEQLTIVVDSVYSIETQNGVSRKVLAIRRATDTFQEIWIEGIGSLSGVLKSGTYLFEELSCPPFLSNDLMCYFENDSLVYHHAFIDNHNCRHYNDTNIKEVAEKTFDVKIIPNPVSGGYFYIESPEPIQGELNMFNTKGQKVLNQTIHLPDRNIKIQTRALPPGIYFLKLTRESGKAFNTTKIIVTH